MSWNEDELKPNKPYQPWDDAADVSEAAMHRYNIAQKEIRDAELALEDVFAGKSAEEIEAEYKQKLAEQETATLPARREEAARQFMIEAPEVVDSVRNGERIGQYLRAAGLRGDNPDDFHAAYKTLASRGLIQINEDRRPRLATSAIDGAGPVRNAAGQVGRDGARAAMIADLQNLRRELPRGPEQLSALDRIVDALAESTGSNSLRGRLIDWGWIDETGRALSWYFWWGRGPQFNQWRPKRA